MPSSDADETYAIVKKRLDSVSLPQTQSWAMASLWTVQEGLEHASDKAALEQARTGTVALLAAVDSLLDRVD